MYVRLLLHFFILTGLARAQVAILQIQVIEGEGVVHAPGTRSLKPLTVQVTDETGRPIEHAVISFHLPEDGPSGVFLSGLRTEVAITDRSGRASIHSLQWNRTPGRFQIRIIAAREQAHAGTVSFQYIGDSGARSGPVAPALLHSNVRKHPRWMVAAALAAAAVTAGVINGTRGKGSSRPGSDGSQPAPLTIGPPVLTVAKP